MRDPNTRVAAWASHLQDSLSQVEQFLEEHNPPEKSAKANMRVSLHIEKPKRVFRGLNEHDET